MRVKHHVFFSFFFFSGVIQCLFFFLTCLVFMKILWIMQIFSNPSIYQSNAFSFRQIGVYLSVSSFSGSQLFQTLPLPFPSGRAAIQSCCMSVFQGCFFCCTRRIFFIPLPDSTAWHLCPVSFFFLFPGVLIFFSETPLMSFWESFQNYWARAVLANHSLQDDSMACICITHVLKMVFTLLNGCKNQNKTKMYTEEILYNL